MPYQYSVYGLSLNACLGSIFFGYATTYLNVFVSQIQKQIPSLDNQEFLGLQTSSIPIGAALGAILSSCLLKQFTIKKALLITDFISIVGTLLTIKNSYFLFLIARLIQGITVGLNSAIVPVYINQISPKHLQGQLGSLVSASINFGQFLPAFLFLLIDLFEIENQNVKYLFPITFCLTRSYFLLKCSQGKDLKTLNNHPQQEIQTNDEDFTELVNENEINQDLNSDDKKSLLNQKGHRRFIIGCGLSCLQQFSGINAICFYSSSIFMEMVSKTSANYLTMMIPLSGMISALIAGQLLKTYGRKTLLSIGNGCCFVFIMCLFSLSNLYGDNKSQILGGLIVALILSYNFVFCMSLGPVVWMYIPEILDSKGTCICTCINWICCSLVGFLFPVMQEKFGIGQCFLIFGFCLAAGQVFIKEFVIETKQCDSQKIIN